MSPPPRPAPVCRGSAPARLREDTGHEDANAREPGLPHSDAEGRSHAKSSHHIVFQKLTRLDDRHQLRPFPVQKEPVQLAAGVNIERQNATFSGI